MNAKVRRKLEMGRRAHEFSRANPDASAGYVAALARLEERLARADALADSSSSAPVPSAPRPRASGSSAAS